MLYFQIQTENVVIHEEYVAGCISRHDWKSMQDAQDVATKASRTGKVYLAVDSGASVWPRYDVIEAPSVGDPVSYGFTGDAYPDGAIVKIGKNYKIITTTTGKRYYRRKQTGSWLRTGGTWGLVSGHHNVRNPSF